MSVDNNLSHSCILNIYMNSLVPPKRSNRLLRIGVLLGILIVVIFLLVKFSASIWLSGQRTQIEQILTRATGLDTRINGSITATLFPTPGISLGGIRMKRNGDSVLAASGFDANFDFLPIFRHKLVPHHVQINELWLQLPADKNGTPLIGMSTGETSAELGGTPFGLQIQIPDRIEIHNSTIVVTSPENKELHFIKGFNLAVFPTRNRLALLSNQPRVSSNTWQLQLFLNFDQARFERLNMGPTRVSARFGPGKGSAKLEEARVFDGIAKGDLDWNIEKNTPEYRTHLTLENIDAGKSVLLFRPVSFVQGQLNLDADLASQGASLSQVLTNASGSLKMDGTNLDLVTTNIDQMVTRIISSQQYNLMDAAAYFFIGPFAVSATKGFDLANVARDLSRLSDTPNKIKRIHTSWQVGNGIASAEDVAMQTQRYLLALKGRVNLAKQSFDNVEIGVINNRGCAIATQKFYGPIASPSMEKTNILFSLTKPMLDALTKSAKGLVDRNCDKPFYTGALIQAVQTKPPEPVTAPDDADNRQGKEPDKQPAPQNNATDAATN